jgi:hypothetical protein
MGFVPRTPPILLDRSDITAIDYITSMNLKKEYREERRREMVTSALGIVVLLTVLAYILICAYSPT